MRRLTFILFLLINLVGCASSNLSPEQRASLKRVSVAHVKIPERPTIFGEGSAGAFLLGGPLGLALSNAGGDLPALYAKQLEKNHVDVGILFKADLERQLRQRGFVVVPDGQPTDAVVAAEVLQYGLTGDIFSSPPVRFPQLSVRVEFISTGSRETIWRRNAAMNVLPDLYKHLAARRIDEYLQDGQLLQQQVQKASALIAGEVMSRL